MANFKKELKNLISRFDAAQEAFTSNSVDVKKLTKQHKKELKAVKADLSAARVEIEALKAELAIAKLGAPVKEVKSSKTTTRRKPAARKTTAKKPAATKAKSTAAKKATTKRTATKAKPTATAKAPAAKTTARRGKPAAAKKATTGAKRGPGRPRVAKAPASPLVAIDGFGPALARQFEAAGVKTPAAVAKLPNAKMAAILATCVPRYRNATPEKMEAYRAAAAKAK